MGPKEELARKTTECNEYKDHLEFLLNYLRAGWDKEDEWFEPEQARSELGISPHAGLDPKTGLSKHWTQCLADELEEVLKPCDWAPCTDIECDQEGKNFLGSIADDMASRFCISREEAVQLVRQKWLGRAIRGDHMVYHETPEYWSQAIYYGHRDFWRATPDQILPDPDALDVEGGVEGPLET